MQAVQMIVKPSKGSLMETLLRLGPGDRDAQPLPSAEMMLERAITNHRIHHQPYGVISGEEDT